MTVTAGGNTYERTVNHVPGDPGRPLTESEIFSKFRRLVEPVAGEQADAVLKMVAASVDDAGQPSRLVQEVQRIAAG